MEHRLQLDNNSEYFPLTVTYCVRLHKKSSSQEIKVGFKPEACNLQSKP